MEQYETKIIDVTFVEAEARRMRAAAVRSFFASLGGRVSGVFARLATKGAHHA
jgi:hypothetical protein